MVWRLGEEDIVYGVVLVRERHFYLRSIMPIQLQNRILSVQKVLNKIITGDTIENLKHLPNESVDMIFADPPYFMQSTEKVLYRADGTGEYKGCDDEWDKYKNYKEYDVFSYSWLNECKRILKKDGTIWVIGSFQNIYRIGYFMQNLGFWILNDVVWNKTNPTPNMNGTRFCNAHETLLWCAKSKNGKYCFNYKTMKYLNGGKQEKSVWTLNICQGSERLKDKKGNKLHTTQKPMALLEKIVLSSTKPDDIILDPFFGTGTTGVVAKKFDRNYIGIEREEIYNLYAEKRIENQSDESSDISNLLLEVKPPKVSIQELIACGYIEENQILYDKTGKKVCNITRDGLVNDGVEVLSIHKMSAKLIGTENYNGWQFFYTYYKNAFICIDKLRYIYDEDHK